jgi:hypothetical protein
MARAPSAVLIFYQTAPKFFGLVFDSKISRPFHFILGLRFIERENLGGDFLTKEGSEGL